MADRWMVHSGKVGDVVYSMPVARALGCVGYVLFSRPQAAWWRCDVFSVEALLRENGFLVRRVVGGGVVRAEEGWIRGDCFREGGQRRGENIVQKHARNLGVAGVDGAAPWLSRAEAATEDVCFVRSRRYRPGRAIVDWRRLVGDAGSRGVFVGLRQEWDDFCGEFGVRLRWFGVGTWDDARRCVGRGAVCVGNQTSLTAVALGLGNSVLLEECHGIPDCRFNRRNEWIGSDDFYAGGGVGLLRPVDGG